MVLILALQISVGHSAIGTNDRPPLPATPIREAAQDPTKPPNATPDPTPNAASAGEREGVTPRTLTLKS